MIRKEKGEFVAICEDCGDSIYGGVIEDFREFVEEIKANGWQIRNNDGDWEHYCGDCVS